MKRMTSYTIPDYASAAIVQLMFANQSTVRPPPLPLRKNVNKNDAYEQPLLGNDNAGGDQRKPSQDISDLYFDVVNPILQRHS